MYSLHAMGGGTLHSTKIIHNNFDRNENYYEDSFAGIFLSFEVEDRS